MFRKLLNATEKRQLELLELLSNGQGHTMEELSSILNYSIRTIRTDIDHFRKNFHDSFTVHLSKDNRWWVEGECSLSVLNAKNRIYEENINVQLLQLLTNQKDLSLEECAQLLHSSYSSLFRNVKTINELLKEYDLTLATKPLHFKGEIRQIRYFYSLLYWGIVHTLPDGVTESYVTDVENFVKELKEESGLTFSMVEGEKLFYFLIISFLFIEREEIDSDFVSPVTIPPIIEEKLGELCERFPFMVPQSERDSLGFFLLQYYQDKPTLLQQETGYPHTLHEAYKKYVIHLSEKMGMNLPNKEKFVADFTWRALHNRYYKGGAFTVGTTVKKSIIESLGLKDTVFVQTALELLEEHPVVKESIFSNQLTFVYWLITQWEGFFDELNRFSQKVRVLVISELGHSQEKFMCVLLEHEFPHDILCYTPNESSASDPVPDIVITDTYSSDILSIGVKSQAVITVDYKDVSRVARDINHFISARKTN